MASSLHSATMAEAESEPKKYISLLELNQHNKRGDLCISIHGKIYNVSNWVKHHPGGDLPLSNLAGRDITDAFLAYHPPTASRYLHNFFTGYYLHDYSVSEVSKDYRKLLSHFSTMGLFENKGHAVFFTLWFVAILFCASVYGVFFSSSPLVHLGCGA